MDERRHEIERLRRRLGTLEREESAERQERRLEDEARRRQELEPAFREHLARLGFTGER